MKKGDTIRCKDTGTCKQLGRCLEKQGVKFVIDSETHTIIITEDEKDERV